MYRIFILLLAAVLLAGCSGPRQETADTKAAAVFTTISQETAREMMAKDDGHLIVDVRRADEYAAGHIPGAVCIPNETIGGSLPEGLPDLDQILLIYCRSGNRSRQAAEKLAALGYRNVYDFGGIIDWTGEVVTD